MAELPPAPNGPKSPRRTSSTLVKPKWGKGDRAGRRDGDRASVTAALPAEFLTTRKMEKDPEAQERLPGADERVRSGPTSRAATVRGENEEKRMRHATSIQEHNA